MPKIDVTNTELRLLKVLLRKHTDGPLRPLRDRVAQLLSEKDATASAPATGSITGSRRANLEEKDHA